MTGQNKPLLFFDIEIFFQRIPISQLCLIAAFFEDNIL